MNRGPSLRTTNLRLTLQRIAMGLPIASFALLAPGCTCESRGSGCSSAPQTIMVEAARARASASGCVLLCPPGTGGGYATQAYGCLPPDGGDAESDGALRDASAGDASSGDLVPIVCMYQCPLAGRRPRGVGRAPRPASPTQGEWLADVAALEHASVDAFEQLATALARFDAPASLIARASRAARDEVVHARLVGGLARAHGHEPRLLGRPAAHARSLASLLADNATEGCVRESLGAMGALHQSVRARDPRARRVFRRIARDEARHALLSFSVDDWARARVTPAARERADRAAAQARTELDLTWGLAADADRVELGLPSPSETAALVASV